MPEISSAIKENFGILIGYFSMTTGNFEALKDVENMLAYIPGLLEKKGRYGEYADGVEDLIRRYSAAAISMAHTQGQWTARVELTKIRRACMDIIIAEDLATLDRRVYSMNDINNDAEEETDPRR
jgi:hypothetical protein